MWDDRSLGYGLRIPDHNLLIDRTEVICGLSPQEYQGSSISILGSRLSTRGIGSFAVHFY